MPGRDMSLSRKGHALSLCTLRNCVNMCVPPLALSDRRVRSQGLDDTKASGLPLTLPWPLIEQYFFFFAKCLLLVVPFIVCIFLLQPLPWMAESQK